MIENLNFLFGQGEYATSGWCYDGNLIGSWMVESVEISYASSGKLIIDFHTIRKNQLGKKFSFV